jgi:PAS domain S-box-containing protein
MHSKILRIPKRADLALSFADKTGAKYPRTVIRQNKPLGVDVTSLRMADVLKILLIDDDDADRAAVRHALESTGIAADVREARGGAEALPLMSAETFDCILMDYQLPDEDGLSVLKQARASGVTTPIIIMTGKGSEQLVVDLMKAGANDYLAKSRDALDGLGRSIQSAVRLHRAERAAAAGDARLRESEERFRIMADNAPVLLWVSGTDAKRTYFNEVWLKFTGRALAQEVGDGWNENIHPDDVQRCRGTYLAHVNERMPFEMEYRLRRFNGEYRWIVDRGSPRHLPDGTFVGFIGSCIDITERRTAEQALRETNQTLRAMIHSSPLAIYTIDIDSRVRLWNPAAQRIFGWREREVLGRFLPVVQSEKMDEHHALRERVVRGEKIDNFETVRVRKDEVPIHVSISVAPMYNASGKVIGAVALTADITERKRTEQDLKQAKETAEAANAAKDRFLAVLSHELRTPLTPVLVGVESIEHDAQLPPEMRVTVEMIRRNVELEARLIDDLLDLTRIARGKLELNLRPTDAHVALQSALDICQPDITAKKLRVSASLTAQRHMVRADSARLQQVFWNLIKNAVKFTDEGGVITVRSVNRADNDARLFIEITDTGIGIGSDVLPRIFDAFEQGEQSNTRRFGGLGLGLAISNALIVGHGGHLSAASEGQGKGATFSVELPTIENPAAAPARDKTSPAPAASTVQPADLLETKEERMKILMVDDHEDTSRVMQRLLETRGYRVRVANSVATALAEARGTRFDLLISDIGLPDGSGLELIREIRKQYTDLPGIALSGFGMEEDVRKSKEAGFIEHLTKPINFSRLQAVISELIG